MTKGWHFAIGDNHYWVGAPDVKAAREAVAVRDADAGKLTPTPIPDAVVHYFQMREGTVIVGRVFQTWTV